MLDIKRIRDNPENVRQALERRGPAAAEGLARLLEADAERRAGLTASDQLKNKKKTLSAEVGKLKQKGEDAAALMQEVKVLNRQIQELDERTGTLATECEGALLAIPNTPHDTVPNGGEAASTAVPSVLRWFVAPCTM